MTSPSDVSPSTDDAAVATGESTIQRRSGRLHQALAWVGIVAGSLFIVAAVFLSGFFLSWGLDGGSSEGHKSPAKMACCDEMKKGEQMMKPGAMPAPSGQMKPGEMMPGGMMGPASPSPTTIPPSPPRS
jgi:hypothetical protein